MAAVAGAAALGIGWWALQKPLERWGNSALVASPSRPVTTLPGVEQSPTFSPDGTQIAFIWNGDLYAKPVDSPDHMRVALNASRPAWSPDGQWIAFLRSKERSTSRTLFLIRPIGGGERSIGTFESPASDISWSPDGKQLAVVHRRNQKAPQSIGLLAVETGHLRPLSAPAAHTLGDMAPTFAPDGRSVAFIRVYSEQGRSEVLEQRVDGGEPQVLATLTGGKPWDLEWVRDGSALIASFHKGDTLSGLWRIRGGGAPPEPLPVGQDARALTLSRTSDRLAYTNSTFDCEMWEVDVGKPDVPPRRLQGSGRQDWGLQLSPDGRRIAFASLRSRTNQIWVCDRDGTNCRQVTTCSSQCTSPRWSPDGRTIAYLNHEPSMDAYAVGEERRTTFAQVEAAGLELRERRDERGYRPALRTCARPDFREELFISEVSDRRDHRHVPLYHPDFWCVRMPAETRSCVDTRLLPRVRPNDQRGGFWWPRRASWVL